MSACPHRLVVWVQIAGDPRRPWTLRYVPRELPCTYDHARARYWVNDALVHGTTGGRTWT